MNSNVINLIINSKGIFFVLSLLIIHLINTMLDEKAKKKNKQRKKNKKMDKETLQQLSKLVILIILAFILIFSIFRIRVLEIIILSTCFLYIIYTLIICPLFNIDIYYNYNEHSSLVCSELFSWLALINYYINTSNLQRLFGSGKVYVISIIVVIIINILIFTYFIILSIYNILKSINILFLKKTTIKLKKFDNKICIFFLQDYFNKNNNHNIVLKGIIIFLKAIALTVVLILRIFLLIIIAQFSFVNTYFNNEKNEVFYIISKISLIISLFSTYCIMVFTKEFSNSTISIFELIVFSIVIPIFLEMLLSRKKTN